MAKTKYLKVKHAPLLKQFPNFHKSRSIRGMKKMYYGKSALLVRCGSFIYNVSKEVYDKIEEINRATGY